MLPSSQYPFIHLLFKRWDNKSYPYFPSPCLKTDHCFLGGSNRQNPDVTIPFLMLHRSHFSLVPRSLPKFWKQKVPGDLGSILKCPQRVRFLSLSFQVTFIFLFELLVAGTLPQVGKDLGELTDDNVICSQCGLGLKNPRRMLSHWAGLSSFIHSFTLTNWRMGEN